MSGEDVCLLSLLVSLVILVLLQVGLSRWLHSWLAERFTKEKYRWLVLAQGALFLGFFGKWLSANGSILLGQGMTAVMLLGALYLSVGLAVAPIVNKMFGIRYGRIRY